MVWRAPSVFVSADSKDWSKTGGALNGELLSGCVSEAGWQVQYTVPFVHVVLVYICGYDHVRDAIPQIEHFSVHPKSDLPLVSTRAERERREGVGEDVNSSTEGQILRSAGPHQLAVGVE